MCMKQGQESFGDVVGKREMRIKSNIKIADRGIRGESSGREVIGQVIEGSGIFLIWEIEVCLMKLNLCINRIWNNENNCLGQ